MSEDESLKNEAHTGDSSMGQSEDVDEILRIIEESAKDEGTDSLDALDFSTISKQLADNKAKREEQEHQAVMDKIEVSGDGYTDSGLDELLSLPRFDEELQKAKERVKPEKKPEAPKEEASSAKPSKPGKKKRKPLAKLFIAVMLAVVIICTGCFVAVYRKLDLINFTDEEETTTSLPDEIIYDDEDYEMMSAIQNAHSLKDYLYKWSNNGAAPMSSKNVINVLLLGLDGDKALSQGGRSDVQMIVSLNRKTKQVNISSLYRDTWVYMNVDGHDRYTKINASYFYGGPEGTIKTIEDNFKIDIDFYAAVDYTAFVEIINSLGGLTIEVQEYEAKYINRTSVHNIEYGPAVTLDGWEALVFARIRHSDADSDLSRTRRQRSVITALMTELKSASLPELNRVVNTLFKYVKTNATKTQILSYAAQALAYNWISYPVNETVLSDPSMLGSGYIGKTSVVFVDLPLAAYTLQMGIYGESNIVLEEGRSLIFDLAKRS